MIHYTKGVKVDNVDGDVKAPMISASVIHAEKIKANSVVANTIFVRDLKRR